jgi:glycosyltransferase involved in cell wall biosynthesis
MGTAIRHSFKTKPHAMQRKAEVCVVVPVFNYGRYLESCLRSVLSQEDVDLTVLVVDDASTDDSLSIARAISDEDSRVQVMTRENNLGMVPTVNEGIAAANSEYLVKLDPDDMLTEGSLKRSVAFLQAFPSVGFVYGLAAIIIEQEPPPPPRIYARVRNSWTVWPGQDWLRRRFETGINCVLQPEAAIRLSSLREVGPYREDLPRTSDFEMWMRLASRYDVGRMNGDYQGIYREHAVSMSRTVHRSPLIDAEQRVRAFDLLFSEISSHLPQAGVMSDAAHRAVARDVLREGISIYTRQVRDQGSLDEYAKLAMDVWDSADTLPEWRVVNRLKMAEKKSRPDLNPSLMTREALRVYRRRMRFWQWRWTGV